MSKKYYSISETADMLGVKAHNVRYLDDLLGKKLTRIRGRRYYQVKDIEILKTALGIEMLPQAKNIAVNDDRISDIISRLEGLKVRLEAI